MLLISCSNGTNSGWQNVDKLIVGKCGESEINFILLPLNNWTRIIMSTFIGKYEAKADVKGRIFIPSAYRKILPDGEKERVVMRKDAENDCLIVFPENVWSLCRMQNGWISTLRDGYCFRRKTCMPLGLKTQKFYLWGWSTGLRSGANQNMNKPWCLPLILQPCWKNECWKNRRYPFFRLDKPIKMIIFNW